MQQYRDKDDPRETDSSFAVVLAAHGGILVVIIALMAKYPVVSERVSAAAQAEFVGPEITSVGPTQLAQPAEPIIDIHQHTNYTGRSDEELIRHQREMGVSKTVLLPAGSKYGLAAGAGGKLGSWRLAVSKMRDGRRIVECQERS